MVTSYVCKFGQKHIGTCLILRPMLNRSQEYHSSDDAGEDSVLRAHPASQKSTISQCCWPGILLRPVPHSFGLVVDRNVGRGIEFKSWFHHLPSVACKKGRCQSYWETNKNTQSRSVQTNLHEHFGLVLHAVSDLHSPSQATVPPHLRAKGTHTRHTKSQRRLRASITLI